VRVRIPAPYELFNNPTGTLDGTTGEVVIYVASIPTNGVQEYPVVVRVNPEYRDSELITFLAGMIYTQSGTAGLTGSAQDVVDTGMLTDGELQLSTNSPQPPDWLKIRMNLGLAGEVTLKIYNSAGEQVRTLLDRYQGSEREVILRTWDGKNRYGETVSSGVYIIEAIMPHTTRIAKVIVLH